MSPCSEGTCPDIDSDPKYALLCRHTSISWFGHFKLCQRLTSAGRGCESVCSKGRCCEIGSPEIWSRWCFHVTCVDLLPKTSGTYLPNLQHQKGTSTRWEHRSLGLLKDRHTRTSQCPSHVDVCAGLYGSHVFLIIHYYYYYYYYIL
jgi:hypothetical protein